MRPKNQGQPWSKEDEIKLTLLHSYSTPIYRIAKELARTEEGIETRLRKLKLLKVDGPLY